VARLDAEGGAHSEVVEAPYASVVSFRDPDGIALEMFVPKAAFWAGLVGAAPGAP
jgi:hypothetical protein